MDFTGVKETQGTRPGHSKAKNKQRNKLKLLNSIKWVKAHSELKEAIKKEDSPRKSGKGTKGQMSDELATEGTNSHREDELIIKEHEDTMKLISATQRYLLRTQGIFGDTQNHTNKSKMQKGSSSPEGTGWREAGLLK